MQGEARTQENVWVENGIKLLHLKLLEALYGCVESAIMWYDPYSNNLRSHGFMVNPYDGFI